VSVRGRQCAATGYLAACLALGGASAAGYLANGLLQMTAIVLLLVAWLRRSGQPTARAELYLLLLIAAALGVILLQFVPLSAELWRGLPGRDGIYEALQSAGIALGSGFVSLIPHESLKSAIWLLPALGMAIATMRMRDPASEYRLALVIVAAMCAGVVLGALQLVGGGSSPLYLYEFTNRDMAVGMFANGNHMASLLLVSIPFEAALLRAAVELRSHQRLPAIIAVSAAFAITLAGIASNGSLAGYGLLLPVLMASALIVWGSERMRKAAALLLIPAALGGVVLIFSSEDAQYLLHRGSALGAEDRRVIFATGFEAIRDFWPFGSGLGTFAEAYPSYEDPFAVSDRFANHAHNDYIELVFETGIGGLAVLTGFLTWWGVSARRVWRDAAASPYARAAVVASAALLVHSLVDYPLRTAGLAAVFAACCALIAAPAARQTA
jgi:hypothetical protein